MVFLLLGLAGVLVALKSQLRFRDKLVASLVSLLVPAVGPAIVVACVAVIGRRRADRTV